MRIKENGCSESNLSISIRNDSNKEDLCRLQEYNYVLGRQNTRSDRVKERHCTCSVWVAMWVMRIGFSYQLGKVTRHCCVISESLRPRMRMSTKRRVASMMALDTNVS